MALNCRQLNEMGSVVMKVPGRIGVSVLVAFLTVSLCYGEAWGVFDKARAIVHNERGILHLEKGQLDQAITEFTKAIELDPKSDWAYSNRGLAYVRKGQYDQAISDCNKALEINPRDAKAYFGRGLAYADGKGQYDQAISDFSKTIELNPRLAEAYSNRGLAYLDLAQFDHGCQDLQKACKLGLCKGLAWARRQVLCQ
jgi:Flp pilus assembly protein TadD